MIWRMLNKKYVNQRFINENVDKIWLELIDSSNKLCKLKFVYYFFEKLIRWKYSLENETAICELCNSLDTSDISSWFKAKCKECGTLFHLKCLAEPKKPKVAIAEDNDGQEIAPQTNNNSMIINI